MRNIIKNLGSIMLLTCLSLILLTGCSRKSQLKLAIEMANKQCPMSIGTTGEISSITFDGTDVIYSLLMNEDYLDLDALGKNYRCNEVCCNGYVQESERGNKVNAENGSGY